MSIPVEKKTRELDSGARMPRMGEINPLIAPYQKADNRRALWELANTLIPYAALWAVMVWSLEISYALTLLLAVLAAGFLVRIFIFFHDCGHNSFFSSTVWNKRVGFWLGLLVFTPSEHWWHEHAVHHATSSNLDKRGRGDVTTLTVEEYQKMGRMGRLGYRLFRNPLVMFGLGPIYMFVISHRFWRPGSGSKERNNVILANLALAALIAGMSWWIGWKAFVMIQLPVLWLGGMVGIWMFYVQHQYEDMYWARSGRWDYVASALAGASFYDLPKVLRWFTGNIGYHHIHHLSPRIPEYQLAACYENVALVQKYAKRLDLRASLRTVQLALWDEARGKMVGFAEAAKS